MQQFDFSENGLKKRQKFLWIMVLVSGPCIFLVIKLTYDVKTSILVTACAITTVMAVTLLAIQMRLMKKSMRAMRVLVEDTKIVKTYSGGEQSLAWKDIVGVDIRENPQGDCIYIKVRSRDKNSIHLWDFERMHEIAELIRQNVSDNVTVETRRRKMDYKSLIYCILGGAMALVAVAFGRTRGAHFGDIYEFVFFAGIALYLLTYRPMTKYNAGWKRYEILFCLFMILNVIYRLMQMFKIE